MFQPEQYIQSLTELIKAFAHDRLRYVGLQGSYLRGEATEHSDIDIMVVIRELSMEDLAAYRRAIASLEGFDQSCGFICGEEEMRHWNPLEICHLLHTTKDYYGSLAELVPHFTREDVRTFVQMSLGNLYHEICHRYIHAAQEHNVQALPMTYKGVFFILQNLHWLRAGEFIQTKNELLQVLDGADRQVLAMALSLGKGGRYAFDEAFALLFHWCRDTMIGL